MSVKTIDGTEHGLARVGQVRSSAAGLMDEVRTLNDRLMKLEQKFSELGYNTKRLVQSEIKSAYSIEPQAQTMYGLQIGLCVSTIDPLKQNRVRFFHPSLHNPNVPMMALPFAAPVSAGFPGFDDCGVTWVPPAGTALAMIFQNGERESPFYFGSIWNRNRKAYTRGNAGTTNAGPSFGCPVPEWCVWEGTRTGNMLGKDDESQVFPPWNTWNYNGYDIDSVTDFENDPEAQRQITYPHIYGIKTPEKGYLRWHDGDRKCNLKWKHMMLSSSRGNFLFFKDDHLHVAGQEAAGSGAEWCGRRCDADQPEGVMEETTCCSCGEQGCPGIGPRCDGGIGGGRFKNRYFKRREEMRPYVGPDTPLNPKVELPQSGVHLQSLSGHNIVMDDSVDRPTGKPSWDQDFDFGCGQQDQAPLYVGKTHWQSATGHKIEMNDREWWRSGEVLRSDHSYLRLRSGLGNLIELNDETVKPGVAGENRGVRIQSTSRHTLVMCDKDNDNAAPIRTDGGQPNNKAKNAYVMLRSGYGLHLYMNDYHSQETADSQFLQLMAPQIDNDRGPHILHMQVRPDGPGVVLLRAGGVLWLSSYDESVETVGEGKDPKNKFIDVTGSFITNCDDIYVNVNRLTYFKSDQIIVLAAGADCPIPESAEQAEDIARNRVSIRDSMGPCVAPVIVFSRGMLRVSDRVFASASKDAPCCSLSMLTPGQPQPCP